MKQPEDDKTVDLFDERAEKTRGTTRYMFYIELEDGTCLEWRPLTLTAAKAMNTATYKAGPPNVARFGWEVLP